MDDVGKLVLFRDIVELESFSKAAARRGLTHSTVSKHLRSLEQDLGVVLLQRTSRTMRLTEEGRVALDASKSIGLSLARMRQQLAELRGQVQGHLRVQAMAHLGPSIVEPAVAGLLKRYPKVSVSLHLGDGPLAFHQGAYDVAVRVGLDVDGSLSATRLMENPVALVASPELLERVGEPEHPKGLRELPTVAYEAGSRSITSWRYLEDGEIRAVDVQPSLKVGDGNALLRAVLAGLGVGYVYRFTVREQLKDGSLVEVLPQVELPAYDPVYIIDGGPVGRPPRVKALRDALFEAAS